MSLGSVPMPQRLMYPCSLALWWVQGETNHPYQWQRQRPFRKQKVTNQSKTNYKDKDHFENTLCYDGFNVTYHPKSNGMNMTSPIMQCSSYSHKPVYKSYLTEAYHVGLISWPTTCAYNRIALMGPTKRIAQRSLARTTSSTVHRWPLPLLPLIFWQPWKDQTDLS